MVSCKYDNHILKRKMEEFCAALAETGEIKSACQAVGVKPYYFNYWRSKNHGFRDDFNKARKVGMMALANRRAFEKEIMRPRKKRSSSLITRRSQGRHRLKLTDHEVELMRQLDDDGMPQKVIAEKFEISVGHVSKIVRHLVR